MAEIDNPQRAFFRLFEDLIRATKMVEHYPYNDYIDFTAGDVVECSYMRGFFKVLLPTPSYLVIVPIEADMSDSRNFAYVGPDFLRKVQVNQEVIRILFNATD
jgi:hypothetical protein